MTIQLGQSFFRTDPCSNDCIWSETVQIIAISKDTIDYVVLSNQNCPLCCEGSNISNDFQGYVSCNPNETFFNTHPLV